jgi:uncharacterized protein with GYD domain
MKKFLIKASYTPEGVKGVLKAGGTSRIQAVEKMFTGVGCKLESFYYAFGDCDAYIIGEVPDEATLAALVLTVRAAGVVSVSTTMLLSPEEIDKAAKLSVEYRAPGN